MRCDDAVSPDPLKQFIRARCEYTDGIRVDHDGLAGLEHVQRAKTRRVADARAGSNRKCSVARISQQPGEVLILRERLRHDARERRGIDRKSLFRHRNCRQAGAATGCGARGHARRAGHWVTAIEQCMAAAVLVAIALPLRQLRAPQCRRIFPRIYGQRVEHILRYADIGNHDIAACIAPGQQ